MIVYLNEKQAYGLFTQPDTDIDKDADKICIEPSGNRVSVSVGRCLQAVWIPLHNSMQAILSISVSTPKNCRMLM